MDLWSLIPNMVSLKQDITTQIPDFSLPVQDYKVDNFFMKRKTFK